MYRFVFTVFVVLLSVACLSQRAAAASSPTNRGIGAKAYITRTATPPVIDGVLNDVAWSHATVITGLHQVEPVEYAKPSVRTVIYVTYDDQALYVAAHLYEDPSRITAHVLQQGHGFNDDDLFMVILDPFNNGRSGYLFQTNPHGLRGEALYANVSDEEWHWQAIWKSAAKITRDGWTAEMRIPFKSLSFDPNNATWGINFRREYAANNESIAWVSRNRETNPGVAGTITGFAHLDQGLGLDVVTALTAKRTKDFVAHTGAHDLKPSLDAFYRVTPSLTGSVTVNTDFSATEADTRQINLGRFALFYPEKREFFLRNSDIFEFGRIDKNGRPFFSRRIGLGADGQIVNIDAGAKLAGRVGRWNIGLLSIRQGASAKVDADTATVARISANVLKESRVGFIATQGSPQSNLDNSLIGFDFLYRNSRLDGGHLLTAQAWAQRSRTQGLHGDDRAFGLGFSLPNDTGWKGSFAYSQLGLDFNPGLGFVNRTGIRTVDGGAHYTYRPRARYLRTIASGFTLDRTELLAGGLQSRKLEFDLLELESRQGDALQLEHTLEREVLRRPFEIYPGVVIPVGDYRFDSSSLSLQTADYRSITGNVTALAGDFYAGRRLELSTGIGWTPSPHFSTSVDLTVNHITLPQGDFTTRLMSLEADIAFTSTLSWSNLVQYDNVSELVGIQSRLEWIPRAGQHVYLILDHNLEDFDRDNRFQSAFSEVAIKANYTFRF